MISLSVNDILLKTGGTLANGDLNQEIKSITHDSRKVENGSLFIAVAGGHDYVDMAFSKGAVCVISEKEIKTDKPVIKVKNSVCAMGDIASFIMEKINVPTVAITGSVGKTTTRDMTYAVMSQMFNTLKNEGNFNNEIGVPLTIFNADNTTAAAVIEMGMDHFGEIDRLSKIARPDVCVITNIGMSHIENLGSQEGIYKAKSEMFKNIKTDGTIVLNGDDEILMSHKDELKNKVITIGIKNQNADITAKNITTTENSVSFTVCGINNEFNVTLPLPGEHNVLNALLAIAVGSCFGIENCKMADALSCFSMTKMRMDIIKCKKITIINDCYNAAPDSVRAALSVLSKQNGRKVAILGDIAALGDYSESAHKALGKDVFDKKIDLLFTIGENARFIAESAIKCGMDGDSVVSCDVISDTLPSLTEKIKENDVVLVKASRVMGLEEITEYLKSNF